ncbi:SHC-transforming protein 1-like, partial [Chiloscyllium plagiosum]|uniref:SHC-transforming protein 1-like n=1 Tax=Chiloscyllium plagiosum TaxID=36176 RepID=UPI001CB860AE
MDLLLKNKYSHFHNDNATEAAQGEALLPSSASCSSLAPILPAQGAEVSPGPEDSPTTLCSFFPRMGNVKLSHAAGLPQARAGAGAGLGGGGAGHSGAEPDFSPRWQDMNRLGCGAGAGGGGKKTRVEGGQLGGDEWTRHGSFVNKPSRGWLHPDDKVMGSGVPYLVRVSLSESPLGITRCPPITPLLYYPLSPN